MKKIIQTKNAPAPIGPYSQAVRFNGNLVFTSGQIPVDAATGKVDGATTAEQTERIFKNLSAVLKEAGAALETVVKVTVFLKNMSDFAEMNAVYAKHFPQNPPARSTVEVARLPMDVLVEIECLALVQ